MDKKDFLIAQASRLPVDERKAVCKGILDTIERDVLAVDARTRFAQLVSAAEIAMQHRYDPQVRTAVSATIRAFVASQMRYEGYTLSEIGTAMGRDHSSVVTMVRRAEDIRNGYFGKDTLNKLNEFTRII